MSCLVIFFLEYRITRHGRQNVLRHVEKKYEINETTVVLHEFKKLKRTVWLNHGSPPDHVRVRTTAARIAASTGFRLSVRRYNKSLACQRWGNEGSTHYE